MQALVCPGSGLVDPQYIQQTDRDRSAGQFHQIAAAMTAVNAGLVDVCMLDVQYH